MDFTKLQIAGLVLGYLKSEECFEAFDLFLQTCSHFDGKRDHIKIHKFFPTRVIGKCLTEFLDEYANIYTIVQGRLEATNYYNEKRETSTLIDRLLYLLDLASYHIESSTPIHFLNRQVQATSAESLPGNADSNADPELRDSKTPKQRRNLNKTKNLNKCLERNEAFDVSELLTQTLLENHELHEKLAETINIVRNTPALERAISEEQISAGASRELDAIIKTVVQRTEEDPMYNKMLDEIIGTSSAPEETQRSKTNEASFEQQHSSFENPPSNSNQEKTQKAPENPASESLLTMIDDQNNHAVQSIIAAAQTSDTQSVQPPNAAPAPKNPNSDVFVFDGTLDTYLKSSGISCSNPAAPTNPVYINTGGLIMMPQEAPKQFYIVNNQPCIKNVLTDSDIMAMPTIIVNDEAPQTFIPVTKKKNVKAKKVKILPKLEPKEDVTSEFLKFNKAPADMKPRAKITITRIEPKEGLVQNPENVESKAPEDVSKSPPLAVPAVSLSISPDSNSVQVCDAISVQTTASPRQAGHASHVRNLNFATPVKTAPALPAATTQLAQPKPTNKNNRQITRSWDADLRKNTVNPIPEVKKSPPPKRKRPPPTTRAKRKPKAKSAETIEPEPETTEEDKSNKETIECEEKQEQDERIVECSIPEDHVNPVIVSPILSTPRKDGGQIIPKTPGAGINFESIHCTPFNDVLEEQLKGVDLISLPTPKIPITPGFSLTPYNSRPTDYSTSSSYYQPSDTEQCKSIGQLIEESEKTDINKDAFVNLRILCDTVNNQPRCEETETKLPKILPSAKTKPSSDQLKKFNQNVIGKKNLNLLNQHTDSSSPSDSSDSESDKSEKTVNNTVICKEAVKKNEISVINNIISNVEVKSTLTKANLVQHEESQSEKIRNKLELVRQRTVKKIKEVAVKKPRAKRQPKPKAPKKPPTTAAARRKKKAEAQPLPPVKSPSKDAAEELVEGLWERGIHLMQNKGAPSKISEKNTSVERIESKVEGGVCENSSETIFDVKTVAEIVDVKNVESVGKVRSVGDYNLGILTKRLEGTVFVERLNQTMATTMACTPFETLLDLAAVGRHSESSDMMDFALTLDCKNDAKESKQPSAKGTKRRKPKVVEDDKNISNKKSKSVESSIKLLNKIDVDVFLDKVHGE